MKNHAKNKTKHRNKNSHTALEQFLHIAAAHKLSALAEGDIQKMTQIVEQSIAAGGAAFTRTSRTP